MKKTLQNIVLIGLLTSLIATSAAAIRIKDIASIEGLRNNQLIGIGLVAGLNGTGDSGGGFTEQGFQAFLRRNGITVEGDIDLKNVAAVIVTATLPPFAKPGSKIDVLLSTVGDCDNLQGGTLLMTPLKAANEKTYAVAQGPVSTGGFKASSGGTSIQENHPTVGRIVNGALIERSAAINLENKTQINLLLNNPDFTTSLRVSEAINGIMGQRLAQPIDPGTIGVMIPAEYQGRFVEFISMLEATPVHPDQPARVVINERTGTIIMGKNVRVSTVAVANGSLSIMISQEESISQPRSFAPESATTERTVSSAIQAIEAGGEGENLSIVDEGVTITELVSGLNALGVTPRALISILQDIKAAGALQANIEVR